MKRPWCWESFRAGGEADNRVWDGWMASPTQWTWIWVDSSSWLWIGRPSMLWFMGLQRVGHDWATEQNWTELISFRMDWLNLLPVEGTLKSLLQHHSSKHQFFSVHPSFMVQLSYPYMTTGKIIVWLEGTLLAKLCLCFLICCLGWS